MDSQLWDDLKVGAETIGRLRRLATLVDKWTRIINLVAKSTRPDIWDRHIEDSARLLLFAPDQVKCWADFGSGGGFPGLVIAIILHDRNCVVSLVESDQRKAAFLREAARQIGVQVDIHMQRAEALAPLGPDVISARALAPLAGLCSIVARHAAPETISLFPKGGQWQAEVAEARKDWVFDLEVHPDPRHKEAVILELRNLRRVEPGINN